MQHIFIAIINDELSHKGRLLPNTGNLAAIHTFCDRIYTECVIPPGSRRSCIQCLLHALPFVCETEDDCRIVFPAVKQLLPHIFNDKLGTCNAQMHAYIRINKLFSASSLGAFARSIFKSTKEEFDQGAKVATERRSIRLKEKIALSPSTVRCNIRRGIQADASIGDQIIACITSSGARLSEILEVGTFEEASLGMIKQTRVAKNKDKTFQVIKPLLACSFVEFQAAIVRIRETIKPGLTGVKLSDAFGPVVRPPVRELYGDKVNWPRLGSHFARAIYAAVAYHTRCDECVDKTLFFQQVLGHTSFISNYNLITIISDLDELQSTVGCLQEMVQQLLDTQQKMFTE